MAGNPGEISVDQLQDWFKIGKAVAKIEIQGSSTGGLGITPKNVQQHRPENSLTSQYRKYAAEHPYDYVQHYLKLDAEAERSVLASSNPPSLVNLPDDLSANCSIANVNELHEEELTQVYSQYNFPHSYDSRLTIVRYKEDIVNAIEHQQVVIVEGATGSGKTTQIPQFILDHYAGKSKHCNIIVTQPRRIAAMSIARRVSAERNWPLGQLVGYQVGMENKTSKDTRLTYVTTGVLLQKLINNKHMHNFTHIILDEVHERDQEMDFCLLVVRKFLHTVSRDVKVVLMSATFDVTMFGAYFATSINGRLEPAHIVSMEGKCFPVSEYWVNDLRQLGEPPDLDPTNPGISEEAYVLTFKLIKAIDNIEVQEEGSPQGTMFAKTRGSILVFLPGLEEINRMDRLLMDEATLRRWWILPLHSSITTEEQALVFERAQPGYRKIILSTNIAESSITVADIKYVIDFCLTKNLVCDQETNYTSLQLEWASRANLKQRRGRTGRVGAGRVYRMITSKFYDSFLPEFSTPEMKRCPLEQVILRVKTLDLGEPKAILALALEPPNLNDIQRTIRTLKEVGALTVLMENGFNPDDGDLTFMGKVLAKLPVDIHIGKLIVLGFVFGCLEECVIIGAGLALKSIFSKPLRKQLEAYKNTMAWADGSFSDCLAIMMAYKTWQTHKQNRNFEKPGGVTEKQWCVRNYLQLRRLRDLEALIQELNHRLERLNIRRPLHVHRNPADRENMLILKIVMCGAFYPHYFLRGQLDVEDVYRSLSGKNPFTTVMVSGLPSNQGILYQHALEDMFRSLSPNIDIYFEASKAYVEFGRAGLASSDNSQPANATGLNKILPAVYYSVKMRELRTPLELKMLSQEDTEKRMEQLMLLSTERPAKENKLRSHRMRSALMDSSVKHVDLPPLNDLTTYIYLTEVVDCGHFWAHYANDETFNQLQYLQGLIDKHVHNFQPILASITPGQIVLAPYTDVDKMTRYYRGRVERVRESEIQIFFVDYGNVSTVNRNLLRVIDDTQYPDLLRIPAQSFECALSEIRPSSVRCPNGVWTPDAKKFFIGLVTGKKLYGRVYSVLWNVVRLELLIRMQDGQEGTVNEMLKKAGYAEDAEEIYLSQQNHQLRERASHSGVGVDDLKADQLQDDWYAMDSFDGDGPTRYSNKKIHLKGPFSPLEIRYYSLTKAGTMRPVRIEHDSVNSIILDPEPHDKSSRLLVAASVGLNPSGNTIVARGTTLMPNIRGLPALMTLLFTPFAELRTDTKFSRYTGALCGLGHEPGTSFSLYPEHDMEVVFDMTFDQDDLISINVVRMCVALALKGVAEYSELDEIRLEAIQKNARKSLLQVVCNRQRFPVEPRSYSTMYRWNRIPKARVLVPKLEERDMEPGCFQVMHSDILLDLDHLRAHIKELYALASRSQQKEEILCELCFVMLNSPQDLLLHLSTAKHADKEKKVFCIEDQLGEVL